MTDPTSDQDHQKLGPLPAGWTIPDGYVGIPSDMYDQAVRDAAEVPALRAEIDRLKSNLEKSTARQSFYGKDAAHWQRKYQTEHARLAAAEAVIRHSILSHTPVDECDPTYDEWEDAIARARQNTPHPEEPDVTDPAPLTPRINPIPPANPRDL